MRELRSLHLLIREAALVKKQLKLIDPRCCKKS